LEGEVSFLEVTVRDDVGRARTAFSGNEQVTVEVRYRVAQLLAACQIGARICSHDGTAILTTTDSDGTGYSALPKKPGVYSAVFHLPGALLAPGSYYVLLAAHVPHRHMYELIEHAVAFEIADVDSLASIDGRLGVVTPLFRWETTEEERINDPTSVRLTRRSPD
jgi:hypothetical protein